MKLGLLARADDRGIGIQTWEFSRNMPVDRTLVVREPGAERKGFAPDLARYPDALVATWDPVTGRLDDGTLREFVAGLDVIYMVETAYDPRLFEFAREAGCATVVHANPEFWKWGDETRPRPTRWWLPTPWRADQLPSSAQVVPVPVPDPPPDLPADDVPAQPRRLVHVAGHRAASDRNGTTVVMQAAAMMRTEATLRLDCQDRRLPATSRNGPVKVTRRLGGVEDRWDLYRGADLLVLPRRYGGLCLPVLEAAAAGVPVVMPDVSPNDRWPVVLTAARYHGTIRTPGGTIPLAKPDPRDLARTLDDLAGDDDAYNQARTRVAGWVPSVTWPALRDGILAALADAADAC